VHYDSFLTREKPLKITRECHFNYIVKLVPVLIVLFLLQAWLFMKFAPSTHTNEVIASLGLGLIALIGGFMTYDRYYQIKLHTNFLEVKFSPIKMHEEFLYQRIERVELKQNRFGFSDVILEMKDGKVLKLRHVDDGDVIKNIIEKSLNRGRT
jgi:hypothetical protein